MQNTFYMITKIFQEINGAIYTQSKYSKFFQLKNTQKKIRKNIQYYESNSQEDW